MNSLAAPHLFNPIDVLTGVIIGLLTLFVFKEFILRPAIDFYRAEKLKRDKAAFEAQKAIASLLSPSVDLPSRIDLIETKIFDEYKATLKDHGLEECKRCHMYLVDIDKQWCPHCDRSDLLKRATDQSRPDA